MSSPLGYDSLLDLPVDADNPTLLALRDRQLRTLFEMALDGMAIADDRGLYLDVNPAACELFGLERDELLGRCIYDFAEPGFDFQAAWQQFQQQEKVRGEFHLVRADGNIRIVEYAATANFLPHRHLSIMRDITERKQAEAKVKELIQQLDGQVPEPVSELEQAQAQLRESQQRLESILNSVEGVVWSIHPETFETIYINPAVEQIFGCSVAEFFANPNLWFEIIHPDDQSKIANAFVRLKEHGKTRTEYRIIRPDGQVRWLSVNSYLVYDETGKPIRIDGITTDISDRIESESRLEQIARHISGVIYQFRQRPDGTFHFPYSSEGMREIYGVSPEEVREDASKIFGAIHPDDLDRVIQSILESAQHLTPWYCEYRVCLPDERMLWLVGNATPQRELDSATLWHGYIRDITDSKRAEANSQRLLAILEITPDLIGTADVTGQTLYLNRSWRNLLDINNNAAIAGMAISNVHPEWALDIVLNQGLPEAAHSGSWHGETAILDPTGREIPVSQLILAHKSTEGKVEYFSTIIRDITESKTTEIALRNSENKFRSIIENLNDLVYIINPDGTFSYLSPQFKNVMGYELAELLDRAFAQWIHPEDLPICVDTVQRSLQGEKLRGIEYRVLHQDGNYYWHSSNLSALRDDEGQVVSCLGIARYIHDQKQAEIALQESNSRWQLAIEGAGDGTWDWNLKTNETIFSRQWKAMLGYAEHEIVNALEEWDSLVHPEDKAQCYEDFAKHLNGETSAYRNEHRLRCKDGSYKWILDRGQVIEWDKEGQPLRFIGTHSDISDRKCAEAKLIEITQLQQAILDGANYTIISADTNGIIKTINAAAQRFLGYSSAEVVDKLTPAIFHDLEEVKQRASELTAELGKPITPGFEVFVAKARLGMIDEHEWSYIRKDNSRFPVQLSVTALQDEEGTITGFLGIASDITARKQVETQLQPAADYASHLIELIHRYQQYYPSPPKAISEFIEDIELEYLVSDFSNLLESMKTGATRISDLVKSLRTFSRLDEADLKAIDVHENIESTLILLQNRLNSSTAITEIYVVKNYGSLPLIECYGSLLNQVFLNLLVNSIDAIEQKRDSLELTEKLDYVGKITITTSLVFENQLLISIQDNGCGMSSEVQEKIFNPFFTTKPVGKGTGMGLATSYQIVNENHRGRLRCCSTPAEGTEFVIELPSLAKVIAIKT